MDKDEWLNSPALLCGVCYEPKADVEQRVDLYLVEARGLLPEDAKRLMCKACEHQRRMES